ncbi:MULTISPECIES: hypothetical protein [unclassified Streptomyces]|nr:hypothetical protein OG395_30695 [Streptomyces sp. NBC_01320]
MSDEGDVLELLWGHELTANGSGFTDRKGDAGVLSVLIGTA